MILAIDPGPEKSAFVLYEGRSLFGAGILPNKELLEAIGREDEPGMMAIEMIASYGMPVGAEVFETCVWIGRFIQAHKGDHEKVYRKKVCLHLCQSPRAKDSNIRQALIDRFGGKEKAIGTKKNPGRLYGITGDVWAALAVAVTYADSIKPDPWKPETKSPYDLSVHNFGGEK